jgi:ATP-binding cassette, subfamily B, bacterial
MRMALPHRAGLTILTALLLAEAGVTLVIPWLLGLLAGQVLVLGFGPDWGLVARVIGALAGLTVLRIATTILSGWIGLSVLTDLRALVAGHVLGLPLSFHHAARRGDLMALMTWEIDRLSAYLTSTLVAILPSLALAIGAIYMMARIDLTLALIVPLLVPVFALAVKILGRRLRGLSQSVQETEAAIYAQAEQALDILPAIKTFTREPQTTAAYRAALDAGRRAAMAELSAQSALSPAMQFIAGSAAVILLGLAGRTMAAGDMTAADAVSFLLYAALLSRPVSALADVWGRTQVARGTLARLSRVMEQPVETGGAGRMDRALGAIVVRDLTFAYPDRPPVLTGLNLTIAAGECVAVTGANGAGKSTLTALMMGLISPEGGQITMDGRDIGDLTLRDLRRQFGHVPQRPLLFHGTIRDNIAFGRPDATDAQIAAAADAAQAAAFIAALPDGYDTVIGDSGLRLSGGQGQRVALARALIKDPPVLILDEATAMYDLDGESAFVEAAVSVLRDRTVIVITHRPATLALAHRILHLQDGRLSPG